MQGTNSVSYQFGDGSASGVRLVPPTWAADTWAQLSLSDDSACALTSAGRGYCWGLDVTGTGFIGNGAIGSSYVPREVAGVSNWTTIYATRSLACGIASNASLFCWVHATHQAEFLHGITPLQWLSITRTVE